MGKCQDIVVGYEVQKVNSCLPYLMILLIEISLKVSFPSLKVYFLDGVRN